jgi:integrase
MCSDKYPALRVRGPADNPTAGVEGPDRGKDRHKQWPYPAEFSALVGCEGVPLRWRRLYALLVYTYMRPNELSVIEWSDVDLTLELINVNRAWDEKLQRVKAPKTDAGVRRVPIEAELVPLLKAMRLEALGKGRVVPRMPPMEDWSEKFRLHLRRAGIDREALFATTSTFKRITLYDLRATGITWRTLRKDSLSEIQEAAGHEMTDTTDGYIRAARIFQGRVVPFPSLPASLLAAPGLEPGTEAPAAERSDQDDSRPMNRPTESRSSVTRRVDSSFFATPAGIEPALPA